MFFALPYFLHFEIIFSERSRACARHAGKLVITSDHDQSGLWRILGFGREGGRRETGGFVSNRFELVDAGR